MELSRRHFITTAATSTAALTLGIGLPRPAAAADDILIGSLHDLSGGLDAYGKPMQDAMIFAAEEINTAGGLFGPPNQGHHQRPAILNAAICADGAGTGASRSGRCIARRHHFVVARSYSPGNAADQHPLFLQHPIRRRRLRPQHLLHWTDTSPEPCNCRSCDHGPLRQKIYVVAADYNYGQIISKWVRKYAAENGGEVVAIDFFPLDVTEFGPTIQKIQAAAPDMVFSALVGGAHVGFYRQWAASGMKDKIPMASSTFSHGQEQVLLEPSEADGIVVSGNYFPSIDSPVNKAFTAAWATRYGADYPYITELAVATYQGMQLWAKAASAAGTTERIAVIEALESGISIDGPSGLVKIDPATHHCTLDIRLG